MNKSRLFKVFFTADKGGSFGSTGDTGNKSNSEGENQNPSKDDEVDIDLDAFEDEDREKIAKIIQRSKEKDLKFAELEKRTNEAIKLARQFQGDKDKLEAKLKNIVSGGESTPQTQAEKMQDQIAKALKKRGVTDEAAATQAEFLTDTMTSFATELRKEIMQEVAPFAISTNKTSAMRALDQVAATNDPLGVLQIPEIRQNVERDIENLANNGQAVTPDVINNIKRIYYAEMLEKSPEKMKQALLNPQKQNPQFQQQNQPLPRFGAHAGTGFGSSYSHFPPSETPPQLNEDTQDAVERTFKKMGFLFENGKIKSGKGK